MYIVLETTINLEALRSKYLLLELDTLDINGQEVASYCVIDSEHIPLNEIPQMASKRGLHKQLIEGYKKQNWDFCEQAIETLIGSFRGEADSFYVNLAQRISKLKDEGAPDNWSPVVKTSQLSES